MKKILTLFSLLILFNVSLFAQNDVNKTDDMGRRQGKWIDYHQNGQIRYTGEFKNNEPIGEFIYYSVANHFYSEFIGNYRKKNNLPISTHYIGFDNTNIENLAQFIPMYKNSKL